jgi:hypothetical protein
LLLDGLPHSLRRDDGEIPFCRAVTANVYHRARWSYRPN